MPIDATKAQALDPNERGLIDLDTYTNDTFTLLGFKLSQVLDDIILVKYADLADDTGDTVVRNGVMIPLAHVERAWRIGQVVLAGPNCRYTAVGDYVCFPSDKGLPCSNLNVDGIGVLKDATFLNEARIFGICKADVVNTSSENRTSVTKKRSSRARSRDKVRSKKS